MMAAARRTAFLVMPLAVLAACSQQAAPAASISNAPIVVKASDTDCKLSRTEADAGTITFEVANEGTKATEFYLYAEDNRIVGEVEDISPGVTRRLVVEVAKGGRYTTACKPGMQGEGIRGDFVVRGGSSTGSTTTPR